MLQARVSVHNILDYGILDIHPLVAEKGCLVLCSHMISIVIPALNEEKLLPDCLNSLKKQNWKGDFEIIVVDNGSTDNTVSVAKAFKVDVVSCL